MKRGLPNGLRLLAVNLLVAAGLLVGALACVEGYLRATIPSSSGSIFEPTLATRRYKVMKPAARIVAWGSEFRTNRLGFRDNKLAIPPKPLPGFRVVVLGDSFTAAAGVDFDRIYTSLLQQELRRGVPEAEVINLAVGGYNIIQYELVLDEVALGLQPDVILVAVFPFNDLSNDDYRANFDDSMGRSRARTTSWYRELYVYRAFLGRVEARVRRLLQPSQAATAQTVVHDTTAPTDAAQNLAALDRIVAKATARGIPIVVALLPNTDGFEAQRPLFAPFESLCETQHWRCINLLERFIARGAAPETLRLNLLDPHPNDRYNDLLAQSLSEYLSPAFVASK